ncbi:MAG: hypothetical protein R3B48_18660 [Kofleriaceae bacterium]
MKLVETDAEGPSGDEPIVTPPRPEKRRVSISLLFTLSVLIATVVTIYTVFPARHNELLTAAMSAHRQAPPWELPTPSEGEARAWGVAVLGRGAPLPTALPVLGAASLDVLRRPTALLRYRVGSHEVSYVVQRIHALSPRAGERVSDGVRAVQWREGGWLIVGVGPESDPAWLPALRQR